MGIWGSNLWPANRQFTLPTSVNTPWWSYSFGRTSVRTLSYRLKFDQYTYSYYLLSLSTTYIRFTHTHIHIHTQTYSVRRHRTDWVDHSGCPRTSGPKKKHRYTTIQRAHILTKTRFDVTLVPAPDTVCRVAPGSLRIVRITTVVWRLCQCPIWNRDVNMQHKT